jgi:exosortase
MVVESLRQGDSDARFWPVATMLALALGLLYWPTYETLYESVWPQEHYSHGQLIPLVFLFLLYRKREHFINPAEFKPEYGYGLFLLFCGLMMLTIGRRGSIILLETASQIPLFFAISLVLFGKEGMRAIRFPVLFLSFMIPPPGIIMYTLTSHLKLWNAEIAVDFLYRLGYPVALDGVVITIAPYRLFLADACAGINSLFALAALGTVLIYMTAGRSTRRKVFLCLTLIPLALLSNFVRVIVLLLATYHHSDTLADQIHELTGYIMFILSMIVVLIMEQKIQQYRQYHASKN